jgi:hypothetical protein
MAFVTVIALAVAWIAVTCVVLAIVYRGSISNAWREPVLRTPVMILESDDWGYGPVEQSGMLQRLAETLAAHRDQAGRHPVMTLGVVLAGPDTVAMRAEGWRDYRRIGIGDGPLVAIRDTMGAGLRRGVFALQLHGREHFWPDCLMRAAEHSPALREWLAASDTPRTEQLPPPLQSRWTNAERLPSQSLAVDAIRSAVAAEVRAFAETFGTLPEVAVPPTFLWNQDVEAAWAAAGVGIVVTPGRRNTGRDAKGNLVCEPHDIHNAAHGANGCMYVVRDVYFEPALGHEHGRAVNDVIAKCRLGRPALVEIHRANFLADRATAERAIDELSRFLDKVMARLPDVRFMSTAELARQFRDVSHMVETRTLPRLHFLLRRLSHVSRLRKLAWITGAIIPAGLVYLITRPRYALPALYSDLPRMDD